MFRIGLTGYWYLMSTYVFLQHIVRSLARSEIVRIDLFWTGLTGYCQSPGSVCSASKPPQGDVWTPIQNTRQTRYKIDIIHIQCTGKDRIWAILPQWWRWRFANCCLCFCSPQESFTPGFLGSLFLHREYNKGVFIILYLCFQLCLDFCCYIFLISYVHVMLSFLRQIDIWTFEIHFRNLNCLLQFWLKLWRLRNRTQIVLLNPENNKIYFHSIRPTPWIWRSKEGNMSLTIVFPSEQ